MPVIRVSDDVYREIQLRASGLSDSPDSTLRRILHIDTESTRGTGSTLFSLMRLYFLESSRRQKSHILAEIKRRFETFGWIS